MAARFAEPGLVVWTWFDDTMSTMSTVSPVPENSSHHPYPSRIVRVFLACVSVPVVVVGAAALMSGDAVVVVVAVVLLLVIGVLAVRTSRRAVSISDAEVRVIGVFGSRAFRVAAVCGVSLGEVADAAGRDRFVIVWLPRDAVSGGSPIGRWWARFLARTALYPEERDALNRPEGPTPRRDGFVISLRGLSDDAEDALRGVLGSDGH